MDHARTLLNRLQALPSACDLDLVVFARHPHTLLSSGQLTRPSGYQLNEIAAAEAGEDAVALPAAQLSVSRRNPQTAGERRSDEYPTRRR